MDRRTVLILGLLKVMAMLATVVVAWASGGRGPGWEVFVLTLYCGFCFDLIVWQALGIPKAWKTE